MTQDPTTSLEPFRKYLTVLAELMREVVVLKYCQGWKLAQIAEQIGRSDPSVASLLRRGLEESRTRLNTKE